MAYSSRILRLAGSAAGLAAAGLVVGGVLPTGGVGVPSIPSAVSVPAGVPSGNQCVSTPGLPASSSPITASGGGSASSPGGGGSVQASSSGATVCVTGVSDVPSAPSLPIEGGLPSPRASRRAACRAPRAFPPAACRAPRAFRRAACRARRVCPPEAACRAPRACRPPGYLALDPQDIVPGIPQVN
jgi:hypothetical protein